MLIISNCIARFLPRSRAASSPEPRYPLPGAGHDVRLRGNVLCKIIIKRFAFSQPLSLLDEFYFLPLGSLNFSNI